MAGDTFKLKVYTPAGAILEDEASAVVLPSSNGEIGILPHHVQYVGQLGIGILEYTPANSDQLKRIVISGGFCRFSGDTLVILADKVDLPEQIQSLSFDKDKDDFQHKVDSLDPSNPDWQFARDSLSRIEAIERLKTFS